jgi:ubiquinone/menaquinone biosynthesis C-methylase UbiE
MDHNSIIRQEFSKQASHFGKRGLTLSSQEILSWIVDTLPLDESYRVLDVAAGTGHLSRAIAPHVKEVVAVDITPEMLAQAHQATAESNLDNITIKGGDAKALPYPNEHFDMVVSRLAIHHFAEPIVQLREMVRVCKPYQMIGVIDLLSPEDENLAETYNHLERLRDPSHTVALSKTQMGRVLGEVGITVESIEAKDIVVDFENWVQMTGTQPKTVEYIRSELMGDIEGGPKTGMRPFMENDSLKFLQIWSIIIGKVNAKEKTA